MANPEHLAKLKEGVQVWNKWRESHPGVRPDFSWADLSGAQLEWANLIRADLPYANLSDSDLYWADLSGANVSGAKLYGANFIGVNLREATIGDADLTQTFLGHTVFTRNDLSETKGLETVKHTAPSTIGIDTIYSSQGKIPLAFLRGCGVPESFITYMPSLVAPGAIQFYSCFISYSTKDQEFVDRLYAA